MSEPIELEDGKYTFKVVEDTLTCKRYNEDWRIFLGDKAVMALFQYALKLQAKIADDTCTCGYILPSRNANNPEVHKENCNFRLTIEGLKNE